MQKSKKTFDKTSNKAAGFRHYPKARTKMIVSGSCKASFYAEGIDLSDIWMTQAIKIVDSVGVQQQIFKMPDSLSKKPLL